jgi:succinylarginine dihydrolase
MNEEKTKDLFTPSGDPKRLRHYTSLAVALNKAIFEPLNKWLESAYRVTVSRSALFDTPLMQEKL